MPAQHHKEEFCHVDIKTGEVLEGPRLLPQQWGSITGFKHLSHQELRKYHWYPLRPDASVAEGDEYVLLWLPEHEVVAKVPMGNKVYRGGQRYAILHLRQLLEFYVIRPFVSPVLGTLYKFPNTSGEHMQRMNCKVTGQDYRCLAETMDRKWVEVTVPHKDIDSLMGDAVRVHNMHLEKLLVGLADIEVATEAELMAMLDTNMSDYYG